MKKKEPLRLLKRTRAVDARHTLEASYTDAGTFPGRLWPAGHTGQRLTAEERLMLFCGAKVNIDRGDRIARGQILYRALEVRAFPGHTEALLEREASLP